MISLRGMIIKFLLQHRHWLQLQYRKKREDWYRIETILHFREQVESAAGTYFGKLPPDIAVLPAGLPDFNAEWIMPASGQKKNCILYFHGGGYISGTCKSHRAIVAKFVKNSQIRALLFEYRLAPESPYPAALEDAVKAYRWLLAQGMCPENIVFLGDSAGGGLCLATLLALRDQQVPLPVAAVAYSAVTDFCCSGESHRSKAAVCLSPEGMTPALAKHYAGGRDCAHPYISPLYGNLAGLPPLLLYAGEDEILRDDTVLFAGKAQAAGTTVSLRVGSGLFHCYPAMAPLFPEATQSMEEICDFMRGHLAAE